MPLNLSVVIRLPVGVSDLRVPGLLVFQPVDTTITALFTLPGLGSCHIEAYCNLLNQNLYSHKQRLQKDFNRRIVFLASRFYVARKGK